MKQPLQPEQKPSIAPLRIGLFGFGCVGQGLYNVLAKTKGIRATIQKICIKHPEKKRTLPAEYFTTKPEDILNDTDIDIVVELIDDANAAFDIVKTALNNGKAVVTANKKMLAEHLEELYALQQSSGRPILYEASCCASIPIIRNLEEYYDNDLLQSVSGIFNGSTNYILSQMWDYGKSYNDALKEAQLKGFAESDPALDVEGYDAKYKLCIALQHAFGIFAEPEKVLNYGIQRLSNQDVQYARQNNKKIKLIAHGQKQGQTVTAFVIPTFIEQASPLIHVHNEYNGVILQSSFADRQFFMGKGAGSDPTGSAVLSDVSALTYNYTYEYKKLHQDTKSTFSNNQQVEIYVRYNDIQNVPLSDFAKINQKFESAGYKYLVGEINLSSLIEGRWVKNDNLSVILNQVLTAAAAPPVRFAAKVEAQANSEQVPSASHVDDVASLSLQELDKLVNS